MRLREIFNNSQTYLVAWLRVEHRKEVHDKVQRYFDIFFGFKRRMRKEEVEEQLNNEVKQGWR